MIPSKTFRYIEQYYQHPHTQLRESKHKWKQAGEDDTPEEQSRHGEMNSMNSAMMIALRDVGRFMQGMDHPEEDDRNPFNGPEDY